MNGALAQRYAAALAGVAAERNNAAKVKSDLDAFIEAFFEAADLRIFLQSPAASGDAKRRVIEKLADRMGLDRAVRNFMYLIVDHRRTNLLREVQQAFRDELNARLGIAEAEVASATELSGTQKQELTAALAGRSGKKIEASFRQDEALLGGAVVRVGSTVYDGSVREQLTRLRQRLETE